MLWQELGGHDPENNFWVTKVEGNAGGILWDAGTGGPALFSTFGVVNCNIRCVVIKNCFIQGPNIMTAIQY